MDQNTIYDLIKKYRDNTASEFEKQTLLEWYRQTAYQDAEFPEDEDAVGEFMLARLKKGEWTRQWKNTTYKEVADSRFCFRITWAWIAVFCSYAPWAAKKQYCSNI